MNIFSNLHNTFFSKIINDLGMLASIEITHNVVASSIIVGLLLINCLLIFKDVVRLKELIIIILVSLSIGFFLHTQGVVLSPNAWLFFALGVMITFYYIISKTKINFSRKLSILIFILIPAQMSLFHTLMIDGVATSLLKSESYDLIDTTLLEDDKFFEICQTMNYECTSIGDRERYNNNHKEITSLVTEHEYQPNKNNNLKIYQEYSDEAWDEVNNESIYNIPQLYAHADLVNKKSYTMYYTNINEKIGGGVFSLGMTQESNGAIKVAIDRERAQLNFYVTKNILQIISIITSLILYKILFLGLFFIGRSRYYAQ
jgi:hypothetical protein